MDPTLVLPADPAPDHAVLVANAALSQAASPTAMLAQRLTRQRRQRFDTALVALVGLFSAQDRAAAADVLDGSFHPHVARRPAGR
jgi:hypothetical protein